MITDKELLKLTKYKLGVFDLEHSITDDELQQITELYVSDLSLSGQKKGIDLTQISQLTNLTHLDLSHFYLGKEQAEAISSLSYLELLDLYNTQLGAEIDLPNLDGLSVEDCDIGNYEFLPQAKRISFINVNGIDFSKLGKSYDTLEDISIVGGKIKKISNLRQCPNLKNVIITSAKIDSKGTLDFLKENGVNVEYDPKITDVTTLYKE